MEPAGIKSVDFFAPGVAAYKAYRAYAAKWENLTVQDLGRHINFANLFAGQQFVVEYAFCADESKTSYINIDLPGNDANKGKMLITDKELDDDFNMDSKLPLRGDLPVKIGSNLVWAFFCKAREGKISDPVGCSIEIADPVPGYAPCA